MAVVRAQTAPKAAHPLKHCSHYFLEGGPRAGSGVVRIDPLRFLAGCRKRQLNQAPVCPVF